MRKPRRMADQRLAALLVGSDTDVEAAYGGRQGKYGVAPRSERTSREGVVFDSKGELARWEELRLLERAGEIQDLRRQVRYELVVNRVRVGVYVADFEYIQWRSLGGMRGVPFPPLPARVVEDFKGVRTPAYRLKKKLMLALYGIEILETGAPQRRPRRAKRRQRKEKKNANV